MKDEQINLKISPEEKQLLRKAARNLNFETGSKENISEAIRHSVRKYAETDLTKPECYFIDRVSIQRTERAVEYGKVHLQNFVDEFLTVTGLSLTLAEIETMFKALGKLGSTAIIQEAIRECVLLKQYNKLKSDHPDFTFDYSNVPAKDLTDLFSIANQVQNIPEINIAMAPVIYYHCYSITEGKISIIPEEVEKLKNNYRFYASSVGELQKLQKVKNLCQALNEIAEDPEVLADKIFTLVYYDREAAKFSPSGAYVKFNLTPPVYFSK